MEEIYNQYLQYDFNNSEEFKDFKEKFPLEPNETVEEHQKRFYKSHICRDFDLNYRPSNSSNSNINNQRNFSFNSNQRNNVNHNIPNNNNQRNNNLSNSPPLLEIIDFGLIGLTVITLFISKNNYLVELMVYFLYRLYFSSGLPRMNLEYLKIIIHQNNFNYFILSLVLWQTETYNLYIIMPLIYHTLFYLIKGTNKYLKFYLFDKIIGYNDTLNNLILYFEIFNILTAIIGVFLGLNKFYFIFIYLQYIKFRYYASNEISEKINRIRVKLEIMRNNSNNPFLRGLASFIQKVGTIISNGFIGGNVMIANGGFIACNIF